VLETLSRGIHGVDIETALAERISQEDSGVVVVVDDEDGSVHGEVIPFYSPRVQASAWIPIELRLLGDGQLRS
jgi:hypothetical protein